ncbi:hypothetical protein GCM10020229_37980 [Kitasatospora albolonga]
MVKQARAYVAEDEIRADARDRLRNEHAVLIALDGVARAPRARTTPAPHPTSTW